MVAVPGFASFTAADFNAKVQALQTESQRRSRAAAVNAQQLNNALLTGFSQLNQNMRELNRLKAGAAQAGLDISQGPGGKLDFSPNTLLQLERKSKEGGLLAEAEADKVEGDITSLSEIAQEIDRQSQELQDTQAEVGPPTAEQASTADTLEEDERDVEAEIDRLRRSLTPKARRIFDERVFTQKSRAATLAGAEATRKLAEARADDLDKDFSGFGIQLTPDLRIDLGIEDAAEESFLLGEYLIFAENNNNQPSSIGFQNFIAQQRLLQAKLDESIGDLSSPRQARAEAGRALSNEVEKADVQRLIRRATETATGDVESDIVSLVDVRNSGTLLKAVTRSIDLLAKDPLLRLDTASAAAILQATLRAPLEKELKRTANVVLKADGSVDIVSKDLLTLQGKVPAVSLKQSQDFEKIFAALGLNLDELVTREE